MKIRKKGVISTYTRQNTRARREREREREREKQEQVSLFLSGIQNHGPSVRVGEDNGP
jgi:hypothetical protein